MNICAEGFNMMSYIHVLLNSKHPLNSVIRSIKIIIKTKQYNNNCVTLMMDVKATVNCVNYVQ